MLKILASADFHLGMKFAGYPEVQDKLAEARFLSLKHLVDKANKEDCALFLIAGDLFDRVSVSTRDIKRAADLLGGFHGQLVAVLPGNHDFYSGNASSLWSRFSEAAGDRILLLRDPRIYDLSHYDLTILLAAGPCDSKHSKSNAISWIRDTGNQGEYTESNGETLRIGVAHGSIEGVSPDAQGVYFPMKREQLDQAPVDFWIIGHTHRQHPSENEGITFSAAAPPPVLIPGTPEPDGFDCSHGGTAWLIEADENKTIRLESLSTGTYRFIREELTLESDGELQSLTKELGGTRLRGAELRGAEQARTLLRLTLRGRIEADQLVELRRQLAEAEKSFFYAQIDDSGVLERISEKNVEAEFTEGSFPYRLLKQLIAREDFEALQTAYTLLQEQKR
jgi:DNA repair exonuclease SbcCD nuclease subunit